MLKTIEENTQESIRVWMLWMMERAGKKNSNVKHRQFCFANSHFQARVATRQSSSRDLVAKGF